MSFRTYLERLEKEGRLLKVREEVSCRLEASGFLYENRNRPVLFENVKESRFRIAGNLFTDRESAARYFGIEEEALIKKMLEAIQSPSEPEEIGDAPSQEVVEDEVDLDTLPLLLHCERDGGRYITSGVVIVKDEELGQNASFHRCMQIGKDRLVLRILPRHTWEFLKRAGGSIDAAICVGNSLNVLLAAATSVEIGVDELRIANTLAPLRVTRAKCFDALIPADCEFVLEGTISMHETHPEGPFVDLTGTYDIVRKEPVMRVRKITHRRDAIWQALLPGGGEHKLLMGMPREPTIYKEVSRVAHCLDVYVNPGGCSWLHAVVKIRKRMEEDGNRAIEAAFLGHRSLKHVFVVDEDIDITDPEQVEWAFATRFQGDRDLVVKPNEIGSSLDPSADPETRRTCKLGFDLTKPLGEKGKLFERARFPKSPVFRGE